MAKDWIKMRMDLPSHPKVVRILSATGTDKFRVVGGLHAVWSVFDLHSSDGVLEGYTPETMDHIIGWEGFSDALIKVKWMQYDGEETLTMPDFDTHNGQSAKRRADETERKRKSRNKPDEVRTDCGQIADEVRSREEESREDKDKPPISPKGEALPFQGIVDLYHEYLPMLPRVVNINDHRKRAMKARWSEKVNVPSGDDVIEMKCNDLNFWARYFKRAANQPFLTGDKTDWAADFDFLLKKSKFIAVLENKYARE